MDPKKYYGGLLFPASDKKTPKHPDHTCKKFSISPEIMRDLVSMAKNGKPIEFNISAYNKIGVKGPFIALSPYIPAPQATSSNYNADAQPRSKSKADDEDIPF